MLGLALCTMTETKLTEVEAAQLRLDELTEALELARDAHGRALSSLGVAIADGDENRASTLRAEIAELDSRERELGAAIPVGQQRLEAATEKARKAQEQEEARVANAQRGRRLEAARKLDAAFRSLARAYEAHATCEPGGLPSERRSLAGRRDRHLRTALYHWAPDLAQALGVEKVPLAHRKPLEDSEAATIKERT